MMNSVFKIVAIYVQFLWQIHSQYSTTLYSSGMTSSSGWTQSHSSRIFFNYAHTGCDTGNCLRMFAADGTDTYIYRSIDTSSYGSLRLEFDLASYEMESGDTCKVYYAYNSKAAKTLLKNYDPPSEGMVYWANQAFNLANSASVSTLWIWFEVNTNDNSAGDYCYVDNVYVKAVPTPQPTAKPTPQPTAKPTMNPTPRPTEQPTPNPSAKPSKSPSAHPSLDPTMSPTAPPTPSPTEVPSAAPTKESAGEVEEGDDDDDDDDDGDDEQQKTGPTKTDPDKDMWNMMETNLIAIFLIFLGLICCLTACLFCIGYKMYRKRKQSKVEKEMEQKQLNMPTNVATNVTTNVNSGSNAMGEAEEEFEEIASPPSNVLGFAAPSLPQSDVFGGEQPGGYGDRLNMLQMQHNMARMTQNMHMPVGYMANPMMNVPQPVVQQAPSAMLQPLPQAPVMPPATSGNAVRSDSDDDDDDDDDADDADNEMYETHTTAAKAPSSARSFGKCSGCGKLEAGKEDEDDGQFYCNGCWESYCD